MNGHVPPASPTRGGVIEATSCPACAAPKGVGCWTPMRGHDTTWTHDQRTFAAMRADR